MKSVSGKQRVQDPEQKLEIWHDVQYQDCEVVGESIDTSSFDPYQLLLNSNGLYMHRRFEDCARGHCWEQALSVLSFMRRDRVKED